MNHNKNIARIKAVYEALGDLGDQVVFVGGATVSLYRDRPAAETRPTDDVDIVVELLKHVDYAAIEDRLRKKGFVNDMESGVICRYIVKGIIVDVMPTGENVLGFKNMWYPDGFAHSIEHSIDEHVSVRIFCPEYFLASKFEAFKDRGKGDGRTSSDFEDIIYILNNRSAIWDEIKTATEDVKDFLLAAFTELLKQDYLYEWISANLEYTEQRRVDFIIGGITNLTSK